MRGDWWTQVETVRCGEQTKVVSVKKWRVAKVVIIRKGKRIIWHKENWRVIRGVMTRVGTRPTAIIMRRGEWISYGNMRSGQWPGW